MLKSFGIEDFQLINKKCPISIIVINNDGDFIYANEKAESVLGHKIDDLLGKQWFNHVSKSDREILGNIIQSVMPVSAEFGFKRKDGTNIKLRVNMVFVPSLGLIGYLEDVTINNYYIKELQKLKSA